MDLALDTKIQHLLREAEAANKTAEQIKAQLAMTRSASATAAMDKLQGLLAFHQAQAERLRGQAMAALASRR
jgi:Lon protease-like protein